MPRHLPYKRETKWLLHKVKGTSNRKFDVILLICAKVVKIRSLETDYKSISITKLSTFVKCIFNCKSCVDRTFTLLGFETIILLVASLIFIFLVHRK